MVADGSMVSDLIKQTRANTGQEVEEALGDCAYGSRTAVAQAEREGVELNSRMPGPRKGFFPPGAFKVSKDRTQAVCPAGHEAVKAYRSKDAYQLTWDEKTCQACPLRDQCTRGRRKVLTAALDFHEKRARERWARSEQGREKLKARIAVEHALGRAKNRGAGKSRYFGRLKTRFQWLWTLAVNNLQQVWALTSARSTALAA